MPGRSDRLTQQFGDTRLEGRERGVDELDIIDLSHVDYMSSRGLRALTMAKQEGMGAGVSVRLASPTDVLREILAISRYDRLFTVDDRLPPSDRIDV